MRIQVRHMREHYKTAYSIESLWDPELANLNPYVQIWYRCRIHNMVFGCSWYRRNNSTRLNHLVCTVQSVDTNARCREGVRPVHMIPVEFYGYVQFYCVHRFREKSHMLMFESWKKVDVHDG